MRFYLVGVPQNLSLFLLQYRRIDEKCNYDKQKNVTGFHDMYERTCLVAFDFVIINCRQNLNFCNNLLFA